MTDECLTPKEVSALGARVRRIRDALRIGREKFLLLMEGTVSMSTLYRFETGETKEMRGEEAFRILNKLEELAHDRGLTLEPDDENSGPPDHAGIVRKPLAEEVAELDPAALALMVPEEKATMLLNALVEAHPEFVRSLFMSVAADMANAAATRWVELAKQRSGANQ